MKFNCNTCKYSTDRHTNLIRHFESKNHKAKENCNSKALAISEHCQTDCTQNEQYDLDNTCQFCHKKYIQQTSLNRHLNTCAYKKNNDEIQKKLQEKEKEIKEIKIQSIINEKDKKIEEKDKEIEEIKMKSIINEKDIKIQSLENELDLVKKQLSNLECIIKATGINAKPNYNSLTFIVNNYGNAPELIPIDDYDSIKCNKEDREFLDLLINCNENNNLAKYLGDILIKAYKKEDYSQQSIWNTDCNRLNYLIKELMNNKSIWSVDKQGIKTTNNIINPLLNFLIPPIKEYIQDLEKTNPTSTRALEKKLEKTKNLALIKKHIDDKELSGDILKYIAPYFYFDKKEETLMIK